MILTFVCLCLVTVFIRLFQSFWIQFKLWICIVFNIFGHSSFKVKCDTVLIFVRLEQFSYKCHNFNENQNKSFYDLMNIASFSWSWKLETSGSNTFNLHIYFNIDLKVGKFYAQSINNIIAMWALIVMLINLSLSEVHGAAQR